MSEYIDKLVEELKQEGVEVPENYIEKQNNINDNELRVILQMQEVTGKKYSDEQRKILEHHGNACILACAGSGKALLNGTGVLTPNGYKPIEKLKIGDEVFDHERKLQYVVGVYPQGKKKIYKVKFNDNNIIKCCEDHLWTIYDKELNRWIVKSTLEIKTMLNEGKAASVKIPALKLRGNSYKNCTEELEELVYATSDKLKEMTTLAEYTDVQSTGKTTSKEVADTFAMLLELEGLRCTVRYRNNSEYEGSNGYYQVKPLSHTESLIVDVEETEEYGEMTCIKVSGLSELFLTEHCIVTHNTTISTHLIAKRILTGEIKDTNKLIYTTYSKAGAIEMSERLNTLLDQLGMHKTIQVRTIHSFFLQVIRTFGVTADIIKPKDRSNFIRQACKDAGYTPKDDELMLIDNLLSYQVNNLLSDKKSIESYINTIEELTLEQYTTIRKSYANQKNQKGLIDYDDMQSLLYLWLVKFAKSDNENERATAKSVRDYCKAVWTDFYIDEAQDTSKIQFAIIRAMVANPDNLNELDRQIVFIGDDDQCIIKGTKILTPTSWENIEDISEQKPIISAIGGSKVGKALVRKTSSKSITDKVVEISTKTGKKLSATPSHISFTKCSYKKNEDKYNNDLQADMELHLFAKDNNIYNPFNNGIVYDCMLKIKGSKDILNTMRNIEILYNYKLSELKANKNSIKIDKYLHIGDNVYKFTEFKDIEIGDKIPVFDETTNELSEDTIEEKNTIDYKGLVYDLELPQTRNFIANGILVHNCIYQWRGGDPSIILSMGPTFNINTFVLSTNYRCYNEIVDYAATGIKCNNSRYEKDMNAFNQGGSVKILPSESEDLCSLSLLAMNHIKWWISQGHDVSDIAVLSRNNFHLAILSNMLLRAGIYSNMTEDMKLTQSYMYKDIKDVIDISEKSWKPNITSRILWKLCRYLGVGNARIIAEFQDNSALSLEDALGWIIKNYICTNIIFDKKVIISLQASEKVKYYISRLSQETCDDLVTVYKALTCENRADTLKALLFQYLAASQFMYKSKDKKRSITGLVKYILNILAKDGVEKMLDFLRVTEQLEAGNMAIPGEKLTLTTMHSAKGREWRDVIMFGCDNVSQPSFDGIQSMMDDGISIHDIFENIDEERRLVYVGNTRAKENLLVITYNKPSVFILEALGLFNDLKTDNSTKGNNTTVLQLVNNEDIIEESYGDFIQEKILSKDSKYFYDKERYKVD